MSTLQVIAGGTSGMGLSTAKALGEYGPVFIGGRNPKRLEGALAELRDANIDAYGSTCDVSDTTSVKAFADAALKVAPIGNVVVAAGVDYDVSTNEQMVHINMTGTVNMTEAFLPVMSEGTLLNYSSITGYFYQPTAEEIEVWNNPTAADFEQKCLEFINRVPNMRPDILPDTYPCYTATKRFVMHYTQANTTRFGARGLRVMSIAPGAFNTPMLAGANQDPERMAVVAAGTAFKRVGDPDEMAYLIKVLLDPKIKYLTGCDIVMDGGKLALSKAKQL
jgi:NAD(P)-dependent dehydrogenase (short-subunit alcohol dehydrogenase family)